MTYVEALETTISQTVARREVENHGLDWQDFIDEVGNRAEYLGSDVLNWLGY